MSKLTSTANGRFIRAAAPGDWVDALTRFVLLMGNKRWVRRVGQLIADAERSPYGAKIADDHHWLEAEIGWQSAVLAETGKLPRSPFALRSAAALRFASTVVDLADSLSTFGQRVLRGRLHDGLNTGFAGLFLELSLASQLLDAGCEVGFPDFEGHANYDLDVIGGGIELAVECKSVSVDGGRKVRRRDFYRFMSLMESDFASRLPQHADIAVVTVADRFPTDSEKQRDIGRTVIEAIDGPTERVYNRASYQVYLEPIDELVSEMEAHGTDVSKACHERFGVNCHVAGGLSEDGGLLIVVRSEREDDASRVSLEARKSAMRQLPTDRPGVIALQYEEITVQGLSKPDFRRRLTILDNTIFLDRRAARVAAIYHCAFDGLWEYDGQLATPAVVSWSPDWHANLPNTPFSVGVSNSVFARLLGATEHDPDDHLYGG